ncbi:hypothetical protein [Tenacibaculum finnmarkense]|uniref:hypothetical protein n=2 Tax=Tenacibaculum finnmarkense TaxID=2781243 RepID=UPI001EFA2DE9|nr:hypothetical protein [Tenacibaculum finnmarkense]MCG8745295.1 hypothetical protein [Tenacibaculum finnmarkense]
MKTLKLIVAFIILLHVGCKNVEEKPKELSDKISSTDVFTNNTKIMDTIKKKRFDSKNENIEYIEKSLIPIAEKFLKQCKDFTPLPYNEFRKQVQKVYGIDIDEYSDNIFPMSYRFIPNIILKEQRIVIDEMMIEDDTKNYFCDYNNLVFYEDQKMIHKFKNKWKGDLKKLVKYYGYHGNKMILSSAFSQIDFYSHVDVPDLLFDLEKIEKTDKFRRVLRQELFKKVYEYTDGDFPIETYMEDMILDSISYKEPDKTLAFIMNTAIDRDLPKWGLPEYIYDRFPEYLEKMKIVDYYGFERLKDYSIKVYGQTPKNDGNPKPIYKKAIINDADGYTNVRNWKGKIVFKIEDGEKFMVSKEGKNLIGDSYKEGWWFVRFKGNEGWVHSSRVTIIKE